MTELKRFTPPVETVFPIDAGTVPLWLTTRIRIYRDAVGSCNDCSGDYESFLEVARHIVKKLGLSETCLYGNGDMNNPSMRAWGGVYGGPYDDALPAFAVEVFGFTLECALFLESFCKSLQAKWVISPHTYQNQGDAMRIAVHQIV